MRSVPYDGNGSTVLMLQEGCYLVHLLILCFAWQAYELYALWSARIDF
jgi:hypothetical protein